MKGNQRKNPRTFNDKRDNTVNRICSEVGEAAQINGRAETTAVEMSRPDDMHPLDWIFDHGDQQVSQREV
jgi:hypothetical protein